MNPKCHTFKRLILFCCVWVSPELSPQRESPLPSVSERLAYLRPSRELLEFYRQKVAQFDGEHDDLLQMLEKYRSTAEEQVTWMMFLLCPLFTDVISFVGGCIIFFCVCLCSISCSGRCVSARRRSRSSRTLSVICRCICSRSESRRCDCTPRTTASRSGQTSPHHRDQSTDMISQAEVFFIVTESWRTGKRSSIF